MRWARARGVGFCSVGPSGTVAFLVGGHPHKCVRGPQLGGAERPRLRCSPSRAQPGRAEPSVQPMPGLPCAWTLRGRPVLGIRGEGGCQIGHGSRASA